MNKIKIVSRLFRYLITAIAVAWFLIYCDYWFIMPSHFILGLGGSLLNLGFIPNSVHIKHVITGSLRFYGFLIGLSAGRYFGV